ncbi:MAG: hypothetical protein OHK0028_14540 [Deltaproteobacteria bacterium]
MRRPAAPLSTVLESFLESIRIPHVALLVSLRKRWPEIAGPLVSRNAIPLSLRNGVLTIAVRNSSWAQELRMSAPVMLARIREEAGERFPVDSLRFAVGSIGPAEEPAKSGPAEEPADRSAPDPEGLSAVSDPETRESLRAIARRSRR